MTTTTSRPVPLAPPRPNHNGTPPPRGSGAPAPETRVAFGTIASQTGHRIVLYGPGGIGKAQPLDAQILTPAGFVPMGTIEVDDLVIGSAGRPHRVLGVYPQGEKDVYEVTFRDGSRTQCCDEHLWHTQTITERSQGLTGAVRSLRDIRRTLRYGRDFNHGVARVQPVQFAAADEPLPVDPWLLGAYLGDGTSRDTVVLHNPEPDLREQFAQRLNEADTCVATGAIGLRVKRQQRSGQPSALKAALSQLGLAGLLSYEKFVPTRYLCAAVDQRLALLRGLLDTDGFVANPGAVEFCTASARLAHDFCFLVRSLGGSARQLTKVPTYTYRGERRQGRTAYRIFASFPAGVVPVSSKKHTDKWAPPRWAIRHTIRAIDYVGRKACQCIRVDAPDSLYVTDDFILTHNTTVAATAPGPVAFFDLDDSLPRLSAGFAAHDAQFDVRPVEGATAWAGIREALHASGWDGIRTIVIDSATRAEELAVAHTLATVPHEKKEIVIRRLEDYGFGKGYQHVYDTFLTLLGDLDQHTRAGRHVILICHDCTNTVPNPHGEDWLRYEPRLQAPGSGKASIRLRVREWADHVLFLGYDIDVRDGKGTGSGTRTIYPSELPHCMAKSRTMADPLPLMKFDPALWTHLLK